MGLAGYRFSGRLHLLISCACLALVTMLFVVTIRPVQAQQGLFGRWQTTTVITTSGYSERYVIVLSLHQNWGFEQTVRSLVFPDRIVHTFGTYSQLPALGRNAYRFVVTRPQRGEMPAWNARLNLSSGTTLVYEDLTSRTKLEFRRLQ